MIGYLSRLFCVTGLSLIMSVMPASGSTVTPDDKAAPASGSTAIPDVKTEDSKTAWLTFDDGPSIRNTPRILDILKDYDIKATFFVNGRGGKELYKRIADEGHVIGNHTYSHNYKDIYTSVSGFKKDVAKLNDYLEDITGKRPEILRFPGGSNNTVSRKYGGKNVMKTLCRVATSDMDYQYFDWNVSAEDATTYRASKDFIVRSVLNGAKRKKHAIILMHDSAAKTTTVEALPEIIDGLIKMGFEFDVLTKDTPPVQFLKP